MNKKKNILLATAYKDLVVIVLVSIFIFILSYFFDIFSFLVDLLKKHPHWIAYVDEVFTGLLTLSISFAIFSWRRWSELKKETAQRIRLQEELIKLANTKAETERIISKQLRCEIEERRK